MLHLRQIGGKNISLHTYFRFSKDLVSDGFSLNNKLYNAYLEWNKLLNNKLNISIGRQFIFAGVGYGTIDGGKIELSLNKWGKLGTYLGTQTPLRESWKVDSWAQSHMIGAYYKNSIYDADFQVSWVRKNRKPVSYSVPGRYSGKIIKASSLRGQLAGLDISREFAGKLRLFVRAEGSISEQKEDKLNTDRFTFDRFEFTADYQAHKKLMITGQYFYRKPRENLNSIFSIFSQSNNRELWVNIYYYPAPALTLFGGWATVKYEYDSTNRFNAGLLAKYFSLSVNKFTGYSGDLDGFTGSIQYPVVQNLWTRAVVSVGRYKLFNDAADYNNMITSSIGLTYTPHQKFSFDIEGQGMRNRISSKDYRIFGRISHWFFVKK